MKTNPKNLAFTLLELMTVLAVIVILTAMVVGVAGMVQNKSAKARATTEIAMLALAAEGYKGDNGSYPQGHEKPDDFKSEVPSDELVPRKHFRPNSDDKSKYEKASLAFYRELTGDNEEKPDGKPDKDRAIYLKEFDPRILKKSAGTGTGSAATIEVKYFQDPFGYPFGYSTAAAKVERKFQKDLRKDSTTQRPSGEEIEGFNSATFDLWSTSGSSPNSDVKGKDKETEHAKWIKNW